MEITRMKYKNLPHIDIPGRYQFITFRTDDSVDSLLLRLLTSKEQNAYKWLAVDAHFDKSHRGNYLRGDILVEMVGLLRSMDGEVYKLVAFSVMPNHVHMLILPLMELPQAMQIVKGRTARLINSMMERRGRF